MRSAEMQSAAHTDTSRNAPTRRLTERVFGRVAEYLIEKFPELKPDHLTRVGTAGVAVGAALASYAHRQESSGLKMLAAAELMAASAFDMLDGAHARKLHERRPGHHDSNHGQLVDAMHDRYQELILAFSRAATANFRGDRMGVATALTTAVTNPLPSLVRAMCEAEGICVKEAGRNPVEFIGTRAGRFILGNIATLMDGNAQTPIDVTMTMANLSTTVSRIATYITEPRNAGVITQKQINAQQRKKALMFFTGAAIGMSLIGERKLLGRLR